MNTRRGVCTNVGRCRLAGARTAQEPAPEQDFVCRECGRPLVAPAARAPDPSRFPLGVLLGVAAFLTMGGLAFLLVGERPRPSPPVAPVRAPEPPAPGAAAALSPPQAGGPAQVLLRLAGSSTVGEKLAPALAEAYLASLGATGVQISSAAPGEVAVAGTKDGARQAIAVSWRDSASGFEALRQGAADVAMSSRRVLPEEVQGLAGLGIMTSTANEHVLALDGIAVIASKANPVSQLRRNQLAAIFAGTVSTWSGMGGRSDPVRVFARQERSGTMKVFQTLVLGPTRLSAAAKRLGSSEAVLEAVVGDAGAVGFVDLPHARGAKVLAVADGDAAPVIPTAFTLANEDYFLTRRLYLYTAEASRNPHVSRFVELALSPAGQALVKKAGFVELTVKAEPRPPADGAPAGYARLTGGSRRLSTTFRFVVGSSELDNRAVRDLDRVVDYLRDNDLNGASVTLLGFADNRGGSPVNLALSRIRARRVAQALAQRGISGVTMAGFGAALPVADNSSEEGRERNRRVEIWISR